MYEIEDSIGTGPGRIEREAIHDQMQAIQRAMHDCAGQLPYTLNAGHLDTALEEAERYFELLGKWNRLYVQTYGESAPEVGPDAL